MPIGVLIDSSAVVLGGIVGAVAGKHISLRLRQTMETVFGGCSMLIGISAISLMENMPAVIIAIIIGTAFGVAIRLGDLVQRGGQAMQKCISRCFCPPENDMDDAAFNASLLTAIVLFCASGTGIYGAMDSGISGEHSILLAKSVLDFSTAMIFGSTLGMVISLIAVPQLIIFLFLFYLARFIIPLTTPAMVNDFKACGGLLIFVTGFRMIRVKEFPVAEMIPAMALVMPVSWLWVNWILPLIG